MHVFQPCSINFPLHQAAAEAYQLLVERQQGSMHHALDRPLPASVSIGAPAAASLYFLIVFSVGFLLGPVHVFRWSHC